MHVGATCHSLCVLSVPPQGIVTNAQTGEFLGFAEASPFAVAAAVNSASNSYQDLVPVVGAYARVWVLKLHNKKVVVPVLVQFTTAKSSTASLDMKLTADKLVAHAAFFGFGIDGTVADGAGVNSVSDSLLLYCQWHPDLLCLVRCASQNEWCTLWYRCK